MTTAIVGGGASGLSLALLLDDDYALYESEPHLGGHCLSTKVGGWTFDRGPHIMFSRDNAILDFMVESLGENVLTRHRESRVCVGGVIAKYPLENDLGALPELTRNSCLLDYLFNSYTASQPANMEDWFNSTFGKAMTDIYFRPYNEKVWNIPLQELSMDWSERIPQPPAQDVVRGALGNSTEGYTHQANFYYPLAGGYQALMSSWADRIDPKRILVNDRVREIIPHDSYVEVTSTSQTKSFDRVVLTTPITELGWLIPSLPEQLRRKATKLQINPLITVTLGIEGEDAAGLSSAYFPDKDFLVNRASWPCSFSPQNGPERCFSIQAEITQPPDGKVLTWTDRQLIDHVYGGFEGYGFIRPGQRVIFTHVDRIKYAYVVYRQGYSREVNDLKDWAAKHNVYLHGRFGAFEYLNVDGCLARSLQLASDLNGRATFLHEAR